MSVEQKSGIKRIKMLGLGSSKLKSQAKLRKRLDNKSALNFPKSIPKAAKLRALQNTTPEVSKQKKNFDFLKDPIAYKTPIRKYSNNDEISSLKQEIASLITKLGVIDVIKDPEKAVKLDEALSQNKLVAGVRSRMRINQSFDDISKPKPRKLKPLNIKIKDQISKFKSMMDHHKASPPQEQFKIEETNDMFEDDEERFKIIKLGKGTSWKKRFQMMYRAKMLKLDKKIKQTPAYSDYRSIMKVDSIMGRRRMLHSIYSTIDDTFKRKDFNLDKETLKTNNFIESLNRLTSNFNSRAFLKKPLQEMLKEFFDPSMLDKDDGLAEAFPLLFTTKKSKKKLQKATQKGSQSKSKCLKIYPLARNGSSKRRKASEVPLKESDTTSLLEIQEKAERKKSIQLLPNIKSKDDLLININIKRPAMY